jgi:hypothetical protein
MKGSRTIFFNLAMLAAGLVGIHLAPATMQQYGDFLVVLWGVGGILLRQLTTTPIFQKDLMAVEAKATSLGLDPSAVQDLANQLVSQLPTGNIATAIATLGGKVESLLSAVGNIPTRPPANASAPVNPSPAPAPDPSPAPPVATQQPVTAGAAA